MRLALALLAIASCADRQPAPRSGHTSSAAGSNAGANMNAAVTVTLAGQKPGRPPIEYLVVDVQLKNDDAAPRWVLIPTNVPPDTGGGIDKLEQLTVPAGAASMAVGRFLGRAGTYAVKLAPGARVTLRKLEIAWWREDPRAQREADFAVTLASDVWLDRDSMTTWFDKDPAIAGAADLDMQAAKHTRSHRSPSGAELPVVTVDATRAPIKLAVP